MSWTVRWTFKDQMMTERTYNAEDVARRIFSSWPMIAEWKIELVGPSGKTELRESR